MLDARADRPATAAALIDAAIELFGEQGFDAVSTRALAERAGVNLAAIQYHFHGKESLYLAAVKRVIAHFEPRVLAATNRFESARQRIEGDPLALSELLADIMRGLIHALLGDQDMRRVVPFLLREFFLPGPHFDCFYEALPRRLHELMSEVVALARGTRVDEEATLLQAHALIGQLVAFHIGQPILFRRTGWDAYTPERIRQITAIIVPSMQRSLGLPETPVNLSLL